MNIMRQSACLVANHITVSNSGFRLNDDSELKLSSVGWCLMLAWLAPHRSNWCFLCFRLSVSHGTFHYFIKVFHTVSLWWCISKYGNLFVILINNNSRNKAKDLLPVKCIYAPSGWLLSRFCCCWFVVYDCSHCVMEICVLSLFYNAVLSVISSFAISLKRKKELVALL